MLRFGERVMNTDDARNLVDALMRQYSLDEWNFQFHPMSNGNFCSHQKRLITISDPMVRHRGASEVRLIILHEIAHALVGPGHDHDEVWKTKNLSIGGSGQIGLIDEEASRPMTQAEIAALVDELPQL